MSTRGGCTLVSQLKSRNKDKTKQAISPRTLQIQGSCIHIPEMTPNLRGLHFCGTSILTRTQSRVWPVHLYVVLATAAAVVLLACPETSCRNRQYKVDRYSLTHGVAFMFCGANRVQNGWRLYVLIVDTKLNLSPRCLPLMLQDR